MTVFSCRCEARSAEAISSELAVTGQWDRIGRDAEASHYKAGLFAQVLLDPPGQGRRYALCLGQLVG